MFEDVRQKVLRENATTGFEVFQKTMLKNSKVSVFDKAYEIHAKNEIHGYLCDAAVSDLTREEVEILISLGSTIIDVLYDYFLDVENASIMYYADVVEWVRDFCCDYKKEKESEA